MAAIFKGYRFFFLTLKLIMRRLRNTMSRSLNKQPVIMLITAFDYKLNFIPPHYNLIQYF